MIKKHISSGVAHTVPDDLRKILLSVENLHETWEAITPLARNEWLCWIESAKKTETRDRRIRILSENLLEGKRRPCCWTGCTHR